jgi:hypothetical protein
MALPLGPKSKIYFINAFRLSKNMKFCNDHLKISSSTSSIHLNGIIEFLSEENQKNSGFINFNYDCLEQGLKSAHLQPYTLVSLGFFK